MPYVRDFTRYPDKDEETIMISIPIESTESTESRELKEFKEFKVLPFPRVWLESLGKVLYLEPGELADMMEGSGGFRMVGEIGE